MGDPTPPNPCHPCNPWSDLFASPFQHYINHGLRGLHRWGRSPSPNAPHIPENPCHPWSKTPLQRREVQTTDYTMAQMGKSQFPIILLLALMLVRPFAAAKSPKTADYADCTDRGISVAQDFQLHPICVIRAIRGQNSTAGSSVPLSSPVAFAPCSLRSRE